VFGSRRRDGTNCVSSLLREKVAEKKSLCFVVDREREGESETEAAMVGFVFRFTDLSGFVLMQKEGEISVLAFYLF
jgi:hypothetical protein